MRGAGVAAGFTIDRAFMNTNESNSEQQRIEVGKKTYEKPAFRYEQVFVTTALACGKIATSRACLHVGSAS